MKDREGVLSRRNFNKERHLELLLYLFFNPCNVNWQPEARQHSLLHPYFPKALLPTRNPAPGSFLLFLSLIPTIFLFLLLPAFPLGSKLRGSKLHK